MLPSIKKELLNKIVETNKIEDIYTYLKPDDYNAKTLIIFDIDNTLLKTKSHLGSDQWFYATVHYHENKGMSHQDAINATLPHLLQIMFHSWMLPVEPATVKIVNNLQKRGTTVIALTARSLDLTYRTIEQLDHVGIHFIGKGPAKCPIKYGSAQPALYINGIIFCGNYDKGEVLAYWLTQINYHPRKVIFIDDKMKNIKSVEEALHKRGYPFVGIRYGYLDDFIKTINQEVIEKELNEFIKQYPESRPISSMPTLNK